MLSWHEEKINGVYVTRLKKNCDRRGILIETFRLDELPVKVNLAMSYVSYTKPGVSRGPHEHLKQSDIFSFIGPGNFLLKLWDNRENSETYGTFVGLYLGQEIPSTVFIPPGVVHGYKNSSTELGMVINYPDKLYKGWGRKDEVDEIRHEVIEDSAYCMED